MSKQRSIIVAYLSVWLFVYVLQLASRAYSVASGVQANCKHAETVILFIFRAPKVFIAREIARAALPSSSAHSLLASRDFWNEKNAAASKSRHRWMHSNLPIDAADEAIE